MYTPEAVIGRNDSKNASTTCRGITVSGRACRRGLASSRSSPAGTRTMGIGGAIERAQEADAYCWQHKSQAEETRAEKGERDAIGRVNVLREKNSIETMVQKLGLHALPEDRGKRQPRRDAAFPELPRTDAHDFAKAAVSHAPHAEKYGFVQSATRRPKHRAGLWASLCCMMSQDDDYVEIVRHRRRVEDTGPPKMSSPSKPKMRSNNPVANGLPPSTPSPFPKLVSKELEKPMLVRSPARSQSDHLLALIPSHLPPQTTSALLAELIKPISLHDEEGYIYIFWLTPQAKQVPTETARSILSSSRSQHGRRISDAMTEYSHDASQPETRGTRTVMLKIGRANNVTRRLNEWQRQCGFALNLVRWYPYVAAATSPPTAPGAERESLYPDLSRHLLQQRRESEAVRKVPCVKRVERLIHLELAQRQVKRQCAACRKEHREWFEVEASRAGVRAVDETVRRWVGWAEEQAGR